MAIYRPRRSPLPALTAVAVGGLLVGLLVGWIAWANQPPDLDATADAVSAALADAAGLIEVFTIEYREAAAGGEVIAETEFRGARAAIARAHDRYDAVAAPLRALAPDRAAGIESAFADLGELMGNVAPIDVVDAAATELEDLLTPAS